MSDAANVPRRPILERMADAKARMLIANRIPKAFYLRPGDHAEFMSVAEQSTSVVIGRFAWANNPTVWRDEPTFDGIPVRASVPGANSPGHSRLYNTVGTARPVPQ